jgi:hypothetical protein
MKTVIGAAQIKKWECEFTLLRKFAQRATKLAPPAHQALVCRGSIYRTRLLILRARYKPGAMNRAPTVSMRFRATRQEAMHAAVFSGRRSESPSRSSALLRSRINWLFRAGTRES